MILGALNKPGKYDDFYQYSKVFGSVQTPSQIIHNKTRYQNQNGFADTLYACTCFSASHALNEMTYIERGKEHNKDDRRGRDLWYLALSRGAVIDQGWYLQGGLDLLREQGLISGYTLIKTVEERKQAIANNNTILGGFWDCDWDQIGRSGYGVRGNGRINTGHVVAGIGYDDINRELILKNSLGENWGIGGLFKVRYDDIQIMDTIYAIHNTNDSPRFQQIKKELNGIRAKELGRWNGLRPDSRVSVNERDIINTRVKSTLIQKGIVWKKISYVGQTRLDAINLIFNIAKALTKSKNVIL